MIFSKNLTNNFRGEHERNSSFPPLESVGSGASGLFLIVFCLIFLVSELIGFTFSRSSWTTTLNFFVSFLPIFSFCLLTPQKKRKSLTYIFLLFVISLRFFSFLFFPYLKNSWFAFLGLTNSANPGKYNFFFLDNVFRFLFCLCFLLFSKEHLKKTLCSFEENPSRFLIFIIFIGSFYYFFISKELLITSNEKDLRILYNQGSLFLKWFFVFSVILTTPLYEEIVYRFIIVQIFGKKFLFLAFLFSFLSFGVAHIRPEDIKKISENNWSLNSIKPFLSYFFYGIFFFSAFYYGNFLLVYPVLLHSLANFAVIHASYLVTKTW